MLLQECNGRCEPFEPFGIPQATFTGIPAKSRMHKAGSAAGMSGTFPYMAKGAGSFSAGIGCPLIVVRSQRAQTMLWATNSPCKTDTMRTIDTHCKGGVVVRTVQRDAMVAATKQPAASRRRQDENAGTLRAILQAIARQQPIGPLQNLRKQAADPQAWQSPNFYHRCSHSLWPG